MSVTLRGFLDKLRENGLLHEVDKTVDPKFEMGAVLEKTKGKIPILFKDVLGYGMPVVAGVTGTRDLLATSLGTAKDRLMERIIQAVTIPGATELVTASPVHQNVSRGFDLGKALPIPTFHEKDSAPFVTAAVLIVKDPVDRRRFTSIRRMQLLGPNQLSILIESPGLAAMYEDMERAGKPLEVALAIGVHPVITLSSQLPTETFGLDKMNFASALIRHRIPMVRCIDVDLEVPADAEIILEGRMIPEVRKPEGPFGELFGYYGPQTMQPVVEFEAMCHRDDPMFQVIFPSSYEHKMAGALMRETVIWNHVRHVVPTVGQVNVTMAGGGRCHAVVSIKKTGEGQGKQAILAAFAAIKDLKHVVVVDDDVDIYDLEDVEWAIATRCQADQDVTIIPGAMGTPLEPSHLLRGVTTKMGIDATYPREKQSQFARSRIPGYEDVDLALYLGPDFARRLEG